MVAAKHEKTGRIVTCEFEFDDGFLKLNPLQAVGVGRWRGCILKKPQWKRYGYHE
jgi:hypothetical protein